MANTRRTVAQMADHWAALAAKAKLRQAETVNPHIKELGKIIETLRLYSVGYEAGDSLTMSDSLKQFRIGLVEKALGSGKPKERQMEIQ